MQAPPRPRRVRGTSCPRARGLASSARLELHEEDVRRRFPCVLAAMRLRVQPAHLSFGERDVASVAVLCNETAVERGERDHDAVRMFVRPRRGPRLVAVLENADALVLEDDLVLVRIGARRIHQWLLPSWAAARAGDRLTRPD